MYVGWGYVQFVQSGARFWSVVAIIFLIRVSEEPVLNTSASFIEETKELLVTIEDCYDALGIFHMGDGRPDFSEIQRLYRHQLFMYNADKDGLSPEVVEYKTLMTKRVKAAYLHICKEFGEDPENGLTETKESLIAERDARLKLEENNWCATGWFRIQAEYDERIKALMSHSS